MGTLKVLYNIAWRLNESQLTGQHAELKKGYSLLGLHSLCFMIRVLNESATSSFPQVYETLGVLKLKVLIYFAWIKDGFILNKSSHPGKKITIFIFVVRISLSYSVQTINYAQSFTMIELSF